MNLTEGLGKILQSFQQYYNIKREEVTPPFAVEAEFHSHEQQYFLVHSATISEAESNEYVYFATVENLEEEILHKLDQTAWKAGCARVIPHANHRNSDVTLVILADRMSEEAKKTVSKIKHYRSYRLTLEGWSHYRLVALELSSGQVVCNRQGQSLKKLVSNII